MANNIILENAKPCPFCGESKIELGCFVGNLIPSADVSCQKCKASMRAVEIVGHLTEHTDEQHDKRIVEIVERLKLEAVEKWNRRA